ncbi:MAG: sigma-70 family RNA polymerase sigma factor [Pseudomonadota bacterium]
MRDTELVAEHDDLAALYADHRAWLVARLTKRMGCAESAADITQSTFVKLLSKDVPAMRSPRAFLASVARCLMIDHLRRRDLERAWIETIANVSETLSASAEERFEVIEWLVEIDLMLEGLGPRPRRVFLLSRLDGLKYREIAKALGVSLRTVETDMAVAIRHCRDWRQRAK